MDYISKGLFHLKKQEEDQKIVMQWCLNNNATYFPVHPWQLKVTMGEMSILFFTVKQTWLNVQTGEKGGYRDLNEVLNYIFKK